MIFIVLFHVTKTNQFLRLRQSWWRFFETIVPILIIIIIGQNLEWLLQSGSSGPIIIRLKQAKLKKWFKQKPSLPSQTQMGFCKYCVVLSTLITRIRIGDDDLRIVTLCKYQSYFVQVFPFGYEISIEISSSSNSQTWFLGRRSMKIYNLAINLELSQFISPNKNGCEVSVEISDITMDHKNDGNHDDEINDPLNFH